MRCFGGFRRPYEEEWKANRQSLRLLQDGPETVAYAYTLLNAIQSLIAK